MSRLTLHRALVLGALLALGACSAGGTIPTPAAPSPGPTAATSVVLPVSSAASPATLPAASGASVAVTLSSSGAPAGATIAVAYSATAPAGVAPFVQKRAAATGDVILAYYTFTPSVTIPLTSFPAFTVTYPSSLLPAGTTIHEAFLDAGTNSPVYQLDVAYGANGATITGNASAPTLVAGKTYVFVFYYHAGIATPTPAPTATPTAGPTATPTPSASSTPSTAFLSNPVVISQVDTGGAIGTQYYDGMIVVGADGNIYSVDQRNDTINVFNPTTMTKVRAWPFKHVGNNVPIRPLTIALGPDNRIWIDTDDDTADLYALDTATGALAAYPYSPGTTDGIIQRMVAGSDGRMWAISNLNLRAITTAGVQTVYTFTTPQASCKNIVAGNDGNLWFGCSGAIGRSTVAGSVTLNTAHGSHLAMTATAGGIWFEPGTPSLKMARLAYDATTYTQIDDPVYVGDMHSMVTGPDGNVYVGSSSGLWEIPIGANNAIGTPLVLANYQQVPNGTDYYALTVGPDHHSLWSGNDYQGTLRVTR